MVERLPEEQGVGGSTPSQFTNDGVSSNGLGRQALILDIPVQIRPPQPTDRRSSRTISMGTKLKRHASAGLKTQRRWFDSTRSHHDPIGPSTEGLVVTVVPARHRSRTLGTVTTQVLDA